MKKTLQLYIWSEKQFEKKQVVNSINPCDLQTFLRSALPSLQVPYE